MAISEQKYHELEELAAKIRLDTLCSIKKMGQGHLGGSFSIVELLAVLYGKQLRINPQDPQWADRDRLVLSKGHAGAALYSALANTGYFDRSWLWTINEGGTRLPSHPDRWKTPGVDATTGSLGQGTSMAAGIATGLRLAGKDNFVYLIVGDGELNEGQCWEAFQYIAHFKLNHCIVIIDDNKKQLDGPTKDILDPFDIQQKMTAFGFYTEKVPGADMQAIDEAIERCKAIEDQAVCIVLDSVKGQGVPFFEELDANHSVKFTTDEINQAAEVAIKELTIKIEGGR
ncbi:transketolase [Enterococcus casseliflavus]|uniref:Transketolase n=1 Tax=Enterococcus casseliflavus TaxID=37734 RepID=A0AAW8UTA3_ENTCA|nr:transketolase [Enterococcus casseliflavus]AYJ43750.1 transketolase [Enterococcus casseliflavus]MBS5814267.1 transketolase [Enterococcus casseliflavus]MCD4963106.1 transketolase [Enterococcus casseliflavus]MDB1692017.1 transketolase [Enterococcus casseliflavus]MDT2965787.1 transketolase [Enterococcus casseliflavus]